MELLLTTVFFAAAFLLLSLGILLKGKKPPTGCCSSGIEVGKEKLSCGTCPSKEAEICADGDKDGFATLAQLGNPARKNKYNDRSSRRP